MRPHSDNLAEVLKGSYSRRLIVDAFYGATRTVEDLDVENWSFNWDVDSQIKADGKINVTYNGDRGDSLTPKRFTDAIAPYGQELSVLMEISAGSFSETVPIGRYRITQVPNGVDENFEHLGRVVTSGSRVELELQDRLIAVRRRGLENEQHPVATSCWAEIGRLSGMQLKQSTADQTVVPGTIYKATAGGRLEAIEDLARTLGGTPYITYDGALSVLPDAWSDPVAELELGENGTILDLVYSMDSEGVCNAVNGVFETADRRPIYSRRTIEYGPLDINGPYGEYTHHYKHDTAVDSQFAADTITEAVLTQVSDRRSYRVPVQCVLNPLLELGDVVTVQRPDGASIQGRIMKISHGRSATMSLELAVWRDER